jgi:carbamoyltransferase
MKIIGISAFYHDSAAALIIDGKIVAAAQEERFSRIKHDASFPISAVKYCLEEYQLQPEQIDAVVFYDKPLLKFERLLETYYAFAPRGLASFIAAIPVWLKEKMFLKRLIRKELKQAGFSKFPKLLFPEHHLSHAASAFYPANFEEAAILTIDGVGEWATASMAIGKGNEITVIKELHFPHSLGLLYSAFTYYLGFRVNSGEYKLMGLAPYGNPSDAEVKKFEEIIRTNLVDIAEDGSIWLNQKYFNYATGLRMVFDKKWHKLLGLKRRKPEVEINQSHCNLSLAIQNITEEVVIRMAREASKLSGSKNLCLAGGVALNCVSNGKLQDAGLFDNIYVQPAAGDAGGAVGAALAAYYIYYENERRAINPIDQMQGAFLGPSFDEKNISYLENKYDAAGNRMNYEEIYHFTAEKIASGKIVGWFQGRMEFGPRALGARSILGDPRNPEMQKKLNLKIKYRESFRPFAPAVLEEDAMEYFDMKSDSPYMLMVYPVLASRRNKLPQDYANRALKTKLYFERSDIPAVTHVDFSARIQTVSKATNEHFWNLINSFKSLTGYSVLINTSFNVRGEPIVCTPEDAYRCFMRTELDYLIIGNYVFNKTDQPYWQEKSVWQEEFVLD